MAKSYTTPGVSVVLTSAGRSGVLTSKAKIIPPEPTKTYGTSFVSYATNPYDGPYPHRPTIFKYGSGVGVGVGTDVAVGVAAGGNVGARVDVAIGSDGIGVAVASGMVQATRSKAAASEGISTFNILAVLMVNTKWPSKFITPKMASLAAVLVQ
jgi:hypothetical protein